MEEEIGDKILNNSINNKINNYINDQDKKEENNSTLQDQNFIYDNNDNYLNENQNDCNKEYNYNIEGDTNNKKYTTIINKNDIFTKINNKKVNNTLNDIYDSIATINETNKRVKNILSNRNAVNKSSNIKRKLIRGIKI